MPILQKRSRHIMRIIPSITAAICILISPILGLLSSVAYAGAVAVPVAAETIAGLLVALGLMVGDDVSGYTWKSDNPYVTSIFESQVEGITSGVPISSETLGQLSGTVVPDGVYTTDGTNYYVGNKQLTASDLFLTAKSLVGVSYYMPTNLSGLLPATYYWSNSGSIYNAQCSTPTSAVGSDLYFTPYYYVGDSATYITSIAFNFVSGSTTENAVINGYRFISFSTATIGDIGNQTTIPLSTYINFPGNPAFPGNWSNLRLWTTDRYKHTGSLGDSRRVAIFGSPGFFRVSGTGDYKQENVTNACLLQTTGVPVTSLDGDKTKLGDSIVKVEPPNDDDNDPSTPPVPSSPSGWGIWEVLDDLIEYIDNGTVTNGGTDFQQFVNNNYNYVNVDVNVPDKIDTNINISGDVTIHEDISLPSGGDGSGFYNPNAADVVSALSRNNPITGLLAGLFNALDPALVGIFSVSVSLLLVLGLWKLIRG